MVETIVVVLGVAVLAAIAVLVKHRLYPAPPDDETREDVAEYIAMMVSVLYAVVLGLALVFVWEAHTDSEDHVQAEASAAHQVRLLAGGLPAEPAARVDQDIEAYTRHVVRVEWPAMAAGEPIGRRGWDLLAEVQRNVQVPDSAAVSEQLTAREALAQLSLLGEARRGRETDTEERLSPILWFGLIVGGVLTVAFMFVFGVRRSFTHVLMVMGLTALITFTILLIHQLDDPFGGLFVVDSTPFTRYFPAVRAP